MNEKKQLPPVENEEINIPFLRGEIYEWKEINKGRRATLFNAYPNRKARRENKRAELKPLRPIHNNRGNNGLKVFHKMSHFYLTVASMIAKRK